MIITQDKVSFSLVLDSEKQGYVTATRLIDDKLLGYFPIKGKNRAELEEETKQHVAIHSNAFKNI